MVDHNVTSNDIALKAAKLEKKVLHLEEEVVVKSKEAENKGLLVKEMERQNKEMKREFEELEGIYVCTYIRVCLSASWCTHVQVRTCFLIISTFVM